MSSPSTAILGGGVIGLALALELRQAGREVLLLERDHCGDTTHGAASVASAGMLGVHDPHNPPQISAFAEYSFALYPEFLARIAELSGREITFDTTHTLEAFAPGTEPEQESAGERLTAAELRTLEPDLIPGNSTWVRREEPCLDPRHLCAALLAACRAAGVDVRENEPALSLMPALAGVTVRTAQGEYRADQTVITAGAWTAPLTGDAIPTQPRRGQMLVVESPSHPIRHTVRAIGAYIVPRADGRVLIGSTVERAGFSVEVQATVMERLHAASAAAFPSLAACARTDQWAGLRPGTPDDLPILGALPQSGLFPSTPRIFAATGHFRNGILLAPATARVMAHILDHRTPPVSIADFNPSRFTAR